MSMKKENVQNATVIMKRTFIIILIGLVPISGIIAQNYKKEWADGKLTWEDFTERKGGLNASELKYFLGYSSEKQVFKDTVVWRYVAFAYMDKSLSWVNPEYKTEENLRYNQLIFDIVEVHRRMLQMELDRVNSVFEIERRFQNIYSSCSDDIERFKSELDDEDNLNTIIFWEQQISTQLDRYKEIPIPKFENRSFGYAFHAGLGSGGFTGSIGKHFNPTVNFIFGFDVAYKKSIFYLNATLGGGKVKKDYIFDENNKMLHWQL